MDLLHESFEVSFPFSTGIETIYIVITCVKTYQKSYATYIDTPPAPLCSMVAHYSGKYHVFCHGAGMFTIALFFIANSLFCLAYIVRDMAWLRAITILAASSTLPYFYFQSSPLYEAMTWQIAFIVINTVNLTVLLLQRRPIKLNEEEKWLHQTTFSLLKPRRMRRLLLRAESRQIQPGETLIEQDKELRALIIILSGSASVMVNGVKRATLYPGDFAGEMSFITGRLTSADVIADEPVRYLIWSAPALERLYQRDPEMKNAIQSIIGFDMAAKLAR